MDDSEPATKIDDVALPAQSAEDAPGHRPDDRPRFEDPVDAIKHYMEQKGFTQRDLVPMIGSRSKVSEVLSGTRAITMPMARALHRHLEIPAESLLQEPVVSPNQSMGGQNPSMVRPAGQAGRTEHHDSRNHVLGGSRGRAGQLCQSHPSRTRGHGLLRILPKSRSRTVPVIVFLWMGQLSCV